jgi:prolipoprotein diacylglyceryltransferase
LPWGLSIDPEHRPAQYTQYATFHPTFLYELIWDLLLAAILIALHRKRAIRAPGLFALYVAGYSLLRIGVELLRVDPAHHVFGLRLNFLVAITGFLAGIAWLVWIYRRTHRAGLLRLCRWRFGDKADPHRSSAPNGHPSGIAASSARVQDVAVAANGRRW